MKSAAHRGLAIAIVGTAIVAGSQPQAVAQRDAAKETTEAYLLPPPEQLIQLSMGYRAALADYLWAHVLVTQGLRLGQKRRFATIVDYLDAITELDPSFREPYRLADALTTMQTVAATLDDVRAVRRILEKGLARFPDDAEMWLIAGEFTAYVAPGSYMRDHPEEAARWRIEGANYLARAAELGSNDGLLAGRAMGGARSLIRAGERDAAIRFYQRALATTTDAALRAEIEPFLAKLMGEKAVEKDKARRSRLESRWREVYPTWSLHGVLAAGPPFDPAVCSGGTLSPAWESSRCATTWSEWYARVDAEIEEEANAKAAAKAAAGP